MSDREGLRPSPPSARLFFALWPNEEVRRQLDAAADRLHRLRGGRRTQAGRIHLTLLFLGGVSRQRLPVLAECAAALRVPPFEIVLDREECWRHNRIASLTADRVPADLTTLVRELELGLEQAGLKFDRRPYKPHVTLLRQADCLRDQAEDEHTMGLLRIDPIVWQARDFVLMESRLNPAGSTYVPIGRFPLL